MTPVYIAILRKHPETAAALIELGADVNIPNNKGFYPIHCSAGVGDLTTLQLLAALPGCELDRASNGGHPVTPLYLAAEQGHTDVVRWLAGNGVNINSPGLNSMTPVCITILRKHPETAAALIELGADVNIPNNRGFCPIHLAAEVDDLATLQLLASDHPDTINIKARNEIEETPLHVASVLGRFEIVKWLTENGADISQAETDGDTPIALASYSGNVEVINWFFELGANVNVRNNENGTPLHNAFTNANIEAISYLLSKGALINAQNNEGKTPLHLLLEQKGIDTAKKDQIVKQHLEEFDLSMVDTAGRTALDYAREHCPELVDIFETQHADETLHEHFTEMPTEFEPSESEVLGEVADA